MSRPISSAMLAHLAQPVTTLCTCIRLTRLDGKTFALTDLDMDITIGGQTYSTAIGYSRTAINTDSAMTVSNANFLGVFDSASLTATDLRSGLFDYASLEVLAVNWADPTMAPIVLPGAVLGEVSAQPSGIFTAELRGITQFLANQIGELYTSACKASLGDWRCKVPLSDPSWTKTGAVVTVAGDNRVFTIGDLGEPRDGDSTWWTAGTLTWTSGANDGRSMEVGSWGVLTRTIGLFMPMPSPIADRRHVPHHARLRQEPDHVQDPLQQRHQHPGDARHPRQCRAAAGARGGWRDRVGWRQSLRRLSRRQ